MKNNRKLSLAVLYWILGSVVAINPLWPNPSWAELATKQVTKPSKLLLSASERTRKKASDLTRSGVRRRMAGVRGNDAPIALIPQVEGRYIGTTLSSHPTFWFYLPAMTTKLPSIELRLCDQNRKEVWAVTATEAMPTLSDGLLKIVHTGQPLDDGLYFWTLTYQEQSPVTAGITAQEKCSKTSGLSGYLEKETLPNLTLAQNPQDRLHTYASNGIWHDLLTELLTLRQSNLTNRQLAADFRSLIFESPAVKYSLPNNSYKDDLELMDKIVNAQVLNCCQFTPIK